MTDSPLLESIIEPGTGKALEIRRGQVLRVQQTEGGQCADFNCFHLHNYREHMHVGRTRSMHGLNPHPGDFLWSAPPRERPMMMIRENSLRETDGLFPRCTSFLYEYCFGIKGHINCQDIQAEAQREFGLTPDDVHDSFNLFMATGVEGEAPWLVRSVAKADDYIELLALMDVLAVPNVCGDDLWPTSNFKLSPLRLAIYQATEAELEAAVSRHEAQPFDGQRSPHEFKVKHDPELVRDPDYQPSFPLTPVEHYDVNVPVTGQDAGLLARLHETGEYGDSDGEVIRAAFLRWWLERLEGSDDATSEMRGH